LGWQALLSYAKYLLIWFKSLDLIAFLPRRINKVVFASEFSCKSWVIGLNHELFSSIFLFED
jgi:hypothetical protein